MIFLSVRLLIRKFSTSGLLGLVLLCNSVQIGAQESEYADNELTPIQEAILQADSNLQDDTNLQDDASLLVLDAELETTQDLQRKRNLLEHQINQLEIEFGPYYMELAEPLLELADVFRELGDTEASADLLDRSLHMVRVNTGLDSKDQISILRLYAEALSAEGEFEKAEAKQFQLFQIAQRQLEPDSEEFLGIVHELRGWHADRYISARAGSSNRDLVGAYSLSLNLDRALDYKYSVHVAAEDGATRQIIAANRETQDNLMWMMSLDYLLYTRGFSERDDAYRRYDLTLLSRMSSRQSGGFASENAFYNDPQNNYRRGRSRASALVAMTEQLDGAGSMNHVLAQVILADWSTLFNRRLAAQQAYVKARALATTPEVRESLERIFSSPGELPVSKLDVDTFYKLSIGEDEEDPIGEVQEAFIKFTYSLSTSRRIYEAKILETNLQDPDQALRQVLRRMRTISIRPVVGEKGFVESKGLVNTVYFNDPTLIDNSTDFDDAAADDSSVDEEVNAETGQSAENQTTMARANVEMQNQSESQVLEAVGDL